MKENRVKNSLAYREARAGRLFVLPTMLILVMFIYVPLVISLIFSLLSFDMLFRNITFVGLSNYIQMFQDQRFYNALWNTALYTVGTVPIQATLALLTAVTIQKNSIFNKFARSIFFLPAITSMTVVAIVWRFLIDRDIGIFAYYLGLIGIEIPRLLNDPVWAMPTIIFIGIWKNFGLNMIILVAGLQGISDSFYEAADIDGANPVQKFFFITIPQVMPTLSFVIINSVISSFQVFDQVFILTQGGPLFRTETLVQYIYTSAFRNHNMPYASTVAVALLVITLAVSMLMLKRLRKGEDDIE